MATIPPINIDLSGLKSQFLGKITDQQINELTETCVQLVTKAIYANWESLAKRELGSTLPEYLRNLNIIDKGRFAKQIILTGTLPEMIESGASPFDLKEGFKHSKYVKYTVPVYNAKGKQVSQGGDWYLTIPFRQGTPGIVGQAGFSNEMPQEIYALMVHRAANSPLTKGEIPSPYDVPKSRAAIYEEQTGKLVYGEYKHKASIYEGLTKKSAAYGKTIQNTYRSFRRAGANSDALSWIHKGIQARDLARKAVEMTDVERIVENATYQFLDDIL